VLEIGVGTGCVSLAIANHAPKATIVATDINPAALDLATRNAEAHGLDGRIEFRQGDLFDVHPALARDFDVICSNPPYIEDEAWPGLSETIRRYEDPRALLAGAEGLDVIRRLVNEALDYLVSGGLLAFEMGQGQSARVLGLLDEAGYVGVDVRNDLAGIPRIATARKPCP
jgi:release factor glutamine methyltransferase